VFPYPNSKRFMYCGNISLYEHQSKTPLRTPCSMFLESFNAIATRCLRETILCHHSVAAASTAPAALKAPLFVNLTSTGYIHSMYRAQPNITSASLNLLPPGKKVPLTPVCKFPPKVFSGIRNNHHRQNQFQLLQTSLPFLLRI
jgi:hypothetical protein